MSWILSLAITAGIVGVYILFCVLQKKRQKQYNCPACGTRMIFQARAANPLVDGELRDHYSCPHCGRKQSFLVGGKGRTR